MKAIPTKIVFYTYSGTIIDEIKCSSLKEALAKVKNKKGNIHYYCHAIYNCETGGLIKEGK